MWFIRRLVNVPPAMDLIRTCLPNRRGRLTAPQRRARGIGREGRNVLAIGGMQYSTCVPLSVTALSLDRDVIESRCVQAQNLRALTSRELGQATLEIVHRKKAGGMREVGFEEHIVHADLAQHV
jgi:hypothetical protein